ncbi:MAG: 1-acyl-sn-glycerol-3-phosphate acyltransferase [Firmicutes bacterium]|uniref:1-acyl-sn-glycerol-3-phosphate acyltransferase n=1 Tax=Candidatus Onthovivens merdipullorum TaxID=2840889 RepID=A0A9D9DID6_9BACL|nr:1-acyl-sn-glycerol-3-phosphate acyltransferase [Candidatus Onthovivens merdipullorum]
MKMTIEEKLHSKELKKPNLFIYNLLAYFWKFTVAKKYHIHYSFIDNPKKEKGPYILLSNHASRLDYMFVAIPLLPQRFNFVAGYNEFFRSHLKGIFGLLQEIPKKNFTPDVYPVIQMKKLVKKGGRICLFPEGMSSISGGSQPVALGSAKLLKFLNVPVYVSHIDGGYLTSPKYNIKERHGKVYVTYKKLFNIEDLAKYSVDEITDILNKEIHTDDYEFNLSKQITYKSKEIAKNIHQLLYKCPKCGKEFISISDEESWMCPSCGNKFYLDNAYNIIPTKDSVTFKTPKLWYDYERNEVKKEIANPDFYFEDEVDIGFLPKYKYLKHQATSNIEGKGILRIDHNGITFKGVRNDKDFEFKLTLKETPTYGMCTDASRFYTFVGGEFIEFYPRRNSVIKWFLVTEELHRLHGGLWQDYKK